VLRAGGIGGNDRPSRVAEVYDPKTGAWTDVAQMIEARDSASAALLTDGRVLLIGGARSYSGRALPTAELFDPATNTWKAAAAAATTRFERSVTTLADGRVLVVGGVDPSGYPGALSTAELYDPATDTWLPTADLTVGRFAHEAVMLADGSVLVAGGHGTGWFNFLGSAERYYPNGRTAS
jgi:N-acetylneuraminic acid mutarotase